MANENTTAFDKLVDDYTNGKHVAPGFYESLAIGNEFPVKVNGGAYYSHAYMRVLSVVPKHHFTGKKVLEVQIQHENGDVTAGYFTAEKLAEKYSPIQKGEES